MKSVVLKFLHISGILRVSLRNLCFHHHFGFKVDVYEVGGVFNCIALHL